MDLLKAAIKEKKKQEKIAKPFAEEKKAKDDLVKNKHTHIKEVATAFFEKLKELNDIPVKIYYTSGSDERKSWNIHSTESKVNVEYKDYSHDGTWDRSGSYSHEFEKNGELWYNFRIFEHLYVQVKRSAYSTNITYRVTRKYHTLDECAKWYNIQYNHHWTQKPDLKDSHVEYFNTLELVFENIQQKLVKVIETEKYKEMITQTVRRDVLVEHLQCDVKTVSLDKNENTHGARFKVGDNHYRVLNKDEVKGWFAQLIETNIHLYIDNSLLQENSSLSSLEWMKLKEVLTDKSFKATVESMVKYKNSYATAYAKRYGFEKFVIPYKDYFIVDLRKV